MERVDRGFEGALPAQDLAAPSVRLGGGGIDGERAIDERHGVIEAALLQPKEPQRSQKPRAAGRSLQQLLVDARGVVELATRVQLRCAGEIARRIRLTWVGIDHT